MKCCNVKLQMFDYKRLKEQKLMAFQDNKNKNICDDILFSQG